MLTKISKCLSNISTYHCFLVGLSDGTLCIYLMKCIRVLTSRNNQSSPLANPARLLKLLLGLETLWVRHLIWYAHRDWVNWQRWPTQSQSWNRNDTIMHTRHDRALALLWLHIQVESVWLSDSISISSALQSLHSLLFRWLSYSNLDHLLLAQPVLSLTKYDLFRAPNGPNTSTLLGLGLCCFLCLDYALKFPDWKWSTSS